MTEKQLQEYVRRSCKAQGLLYYHTHNSKHSPPGFPDCVIISTDPHCIIYAELKSEKGRVTPAQAGWLDALTLLAASSSSNLMRVYLWRPKHWLSGEISRCLAGADDLITCRWMPSKSEREAIMRAAQKRRSHQFIARVHRGPKAPS